MENNLREIIAMALWFTSSKSSKAWEELGAQCKQKWYKKADDFIEVIKPVVAPKE